MVLLSMKLNTKIFKIVNRLFVAFLCLVLWQGCFKFRTSDPEVLNKFSEKNREVRFGEYPYEASKSIHYVESGDSTAPTILFVHGTPGSSNNFQNFLEDSTLATLYRMISIDRPGFGYSNFGKSETIEKQVTLFNAFLKSKNNGKPVILAGHSLGGPIVVAMAARDSSIAETLLLLAGSVSPEHEPAEKWRKPLSWPLFRWLAPGAMRPSNDEMLDFKTYVRQMPLLLQQVKCTTYLIHGTKDMFVPYENVAFAEKYLTHDKATNVITLENENHFIPWTKFDDLRSLLIYISKELNK
jgi:pimeloyl-ACP methyl ester carboxylesterase